MNVLITGCSGLIGSALAAYLPSCGHNIYPMVRGKERASGFYWQPTQNKIAMDGAVPIDAVINLAGENIASGRWTKRKKDEILQSRVRGTQLLCETLAKMDNKPRVLISGSAMGYYGNVGETLVDEKSPPGTDFFSEVAVQWENAAKIAEDAGIRTIYLRTGLVMSAQGGALEKMLLPFKLGLGGKWGDGKHYISWVSIHDVVRIIQFLLEHDTIAGPVNMVAKQPVTNAEFTKALGRAVNRPTIFSMPAFVARLLLGEMADVALLSSIRVHPSVLEKAGYTFVDDTIDDCLQHVLQTT